MLLIMIFNFFVGFVDVYAAGFISPEVQAAVDFVSLRYFFVIIIANAISIGTVALVSRAIGDGYIRKTGKALGLEGTDRNVLCQNQMVQIGNKVIRLDNSRIPIISAI